MLHMGPLAILTTLLPLSAWAAPMCTVRPASSSASSASSPSSTATGVSGTSSNSGGNNSSKPSDFVATTWYAGWHDTLLEPEDIAWDKYTSATYAFATTVDDPTQVGNLDEQNQGLLTRFVKAAHSNNAEAYLTIGGWTGSAYFSTNVGNSGNRTAFAGKMVELLQDNDLDGLDFDWEYPGKAGAECNIVAPDDTANFLSFLQELRARPEMNGKKITAATSVLPFAGPDGNPMQNVSAFADVFDYIAIMNYDVWGSFSDAVGPNAPLDDTCETDPDHQKGSAVSAVKAWTAAGFPANKLVLGVAAYGHSFGVTKEDALDSTASAAVTNGTLALQAWPKFTLPQPKGDATDEDAQPSTTSCGITVPGGFSGIFNFFGLIDSGYLDASGNPVAGKGYRFDECSQTPYMYDVDTQTMVSFDNAQSFAAKGNFIKNSGLRGFAMWETAGDKDDILLNSIKTAMTS